MVFREWIDLLKACGLWNTNIIELLLKPLEDSSNKTEMRFCHDSREVQKADIYIAFPGERVNGHDYVDDAFRAGASLAIVSEIRPYNGHCLYVDDTRRFVQELAGRWWKVLSPKGIGVTGSNGKTTTKEWAKDILCQFFPSEAVFCNPGNQNTEIGLPLCILNGLTKQHRWAVLEMGLSQPGDLSTLTALFPLSCSVLLNVGSAHVGNFEGYEGLFRAKSEIIQASMPGTDVVLYANDPRMCALESEYPGRKVTYFGENLPDTKADHSVNLVAYRINLHRERPVTEITLKIRNHLIMLSFPLFLHRGFVLDLCAALAACSTIIETERLIDFTPDLLTLPKDRFEIQPLQGNWMIIDHYNASYESLNAALDLLVEMKRIGFIPHFRLVLGSVLETGGYTDEIHARIGEKILESGPLSVYLFSREPSILKTKSVLQKDPDDRPDSTQDRILFFESSNPEEIAIKIARDVSTSNNHVFYFKASRMVRMEEVVESVLDLLDRGNCHDSDLQIQHTSF
ncbi:MAG: hypothetical protein GXY29_08040 [Thermotogaceae bacterium]|nr:hypothetical protein [Thermotogaceae bacterium]